MMRRLFRNLLLGLLLCVLLSGFGLAWLLNSEGGLRFLSAQAPRWVPGELRIGSVEGKLLGEFNLDDLHYRQDALQIDLGNLNGQWSPSDLFKAILHINALELNDLQIQLPPPVTPAAPRAPLELPNISLPLALQLDRLQLNTVSLRQGTAPPILIDRLLLASTAAQRLSINRLELAAPQIETQITGHFGLQAPHALRLDLAWRMPLPASVQASPPLYAQGTATLSGDLAHLHVQHQLTQPQALSLSADLYQPLRQPTWQATLAWQAVQWPPQTDTPLFKSQGGKLQASGDLQHYQLDVQSQIESQQLPAGQWHMQATGDAQQLTLRQLHGALLDGRLDMQGTLAWLPQPQWNLKLQLADINPAVHWPEWDGKLGLQLATVGKLEAGQPQATLSLERLDGTLRGYPLHLETQVAIAGQQYTAKNLEARVGSAHLQASAEYGERIKAQWQLTAPRLQELLPQARGSFSTQGSLTGTLRSLDVKLSAEGQQLAYEALQLARFKVSLAQTGLALETGKPLSQQPGRLDLELSELRQGQPVLLDSLRLNGRGTLTAHQLDAQLQTPQVKLAGQLQGGWQAAAQRWNGLLQSLTISPAQLSDSWSLASAAPLQLSASEVVLSNACLQLRSKLVQAPQLCLSLQHQPKHGQRLQATLKHLSTTLFSPFLPPTLLITSQLDGTLDAQLAPNGSLQVKTALQLAAGKLAYTQNDQKHRLTFQGARLNLDIDPRQGLQGQFSLGIQDPENLRAELRLPALTRLPLAPKQPLQGSLRAQLKDLTWLPQLVPAIERFEGSLQLDAKAAGSLDAPLLQGQLQLLSSALVLPDLGLELKKIDLKLNATPQGQGQHLVLNGSLSSGEGQAQLDGLLDWQPKQPWQASAQVRGQDLLIINNPTAWALLSPDVRVTANSQQIQLSGTLRVPNARITPVIGGANTSAVRVSADTVLVNPKRPVAPAAANPLNLSGELHLLLDEQISLQVADFKSHLGGQLRLLFKPGQRLPVGDGTVKVLDGQYRAYGQDLRIKEGRVVFAQVPVDSPTLDIQAVRRIYGDPAVETVGVTIRGSAQRPQIKLFSDPPLKEEKILPYLVLGSSGEGNNRSLSLGLYLLPNFYVSYGFNILSGSSNGTAEPNQTLNLRYELNRQWGVESEFSSQDKGVDLSYTFER